MKRRRRRPLAVVNANVITMIAETPRAEALACRAGRLELVGTTTAVLAHVAGRPEYKVIDAEGRTVIPGLIDTHLHPVLYGLSKTMLDMRSPPIRSLDEIYAIVAKSAANLPAGEWIVGVNFDDSKLVEDAYPTLARLDEIAPAHPVLLLRYCGHISVVNSLALEAAGVTPQTPDPQGGTYVKDAKGRFTGVVHETAQDVIRDAVPKPAPEVVDAILGGVLKELLQHGITSIVDGMVGLSGMDEFTSYQRLARKGRYPVRITVNFNAKTLAHLRALQILQGFGDEFLKIGGVKIIADGVMTGRTAALSMDYLVDGEPQPGKRGLRYYSQEELDALVRTSHDAGYQVNVHAIGDEAIAMVVTAVERAQAANPRRDARHRIVHCGVCPPALIDRIKAAELVPVPQPIFVYGDGIMYKKSLPAELRDWAYPLRAFLDAGLTVPGSSDCPAVSGDQPLNPFWGIWNAVTRELYEGGTYVPEQCVTPREALEMFTINSAWANFEEGEKGSLEPGKFADFVVLSADPLQCSAAALRDVHALLTVVDGRVAFRDREYKPRYRENGE